jgi:hypothetical protein
VWCRFLETAHELGGDAKFVLAFRYPIPRQSKAAGSAARPALIYPHLARFAFCEFPRTPLFLMRSWQIPSIATFAVRTPEQKFAFCESTDKAVRGTFRRLCTGRRASREPTQLDRHRDAAVSSLSFPALSCRSCRPNAPFAELMRLSRTSIADEMREEHTRRVLGE